MAMSLPPDRPLSALLPAKPRLSAEERRTWQEDQLKALRLRMAMWNELDARGITTPADIGAALGMPAAEAIMLMTRHRSCEDGVALLETAAARLGVKVPGTPGEPD